jgi:hypothetical protein
MTVKLIPPWSRPVADLCRDRGKGHRVKLKPLLFWRDRFPSADYYHAAVQPVGYGPILAP